MTDRFDPNIPPAGPTDPAIEGEFTGIVAITEQPTLGKSNLVVNRDKPFDIKVNWHVFGNLVPLWLTALSGQLPELGRDGVRRVAGPRRRGQRSAACSCPWGRVFSLDEAYTATLTVPANTLSEENPGDPTQSGTYKIVVTAFLDSNLGPVGYDMMGYAEGPIIKVESPL